jgi:hypothetical protein
VVKELMVEVKKNPQKYRRIREKDFNVHYFFESYGVKIDVVTNEAAALKEIKDLVRYHLVNRIREIGERGIEHQFRLVRNASGKDSLYKNGEKIAVRVPRASLLESLGSDIRLTVAEFAKERVFVHSGVVSWKGRAILLPARSFRGKTTLTAALIKRGALYYSDEYAVLDKEGFVHPFAKPLSLRGEIDEHTQIDYEIEKLGGKAGTEKIPVGMVLITEYKPNGKWRPTRLSSANGVIELIKNTVPVRNNPEFSLEVLSRVAERAIFVKSRRGDVSKSVDLILDFFDTVCCQSKES